MVATCCFVATSRINSEENRALGSWPLAKKPGSKPNRASCCYVATTRINSGCERVLEGADRTRPAPFWTNNREGGHTPTVGSDPRTPQSTAGRGIWPMDSRSPAKSGIAHAHKTAQYSVVKDRTCKLLGPGATAKVSQAGHMPTYFKTLIKLLQCYL